MIDDKDVELVRGLVERHLGHHAFPAGVRPEDEALNTTLLEREEPVGCELTMKQTRLFLDGLGIRAGERYVSLFREEAIFAKMGEAHGGEAVTVGSVARRIAGKIAEARTGVRPEPPPASAQPAPGQARPFAISIACTRRPGRRARRRA